MNIALWIMQALLAFAFLMGGGMKLATPMDELIAAGMGGWVAASPELLVRFIGLSEVLGAIGLIVPWATGIAPKLTPAAAGGLLIVMVLGAATHLSFGETGAILPNIVLGGMAAFVVWGRLTPASEATARVDSPAV